MNKLLNFISTKYHWLIFMVYVILSATMLFRNNPYQQSVYLTSANGISVAVYEGINSITSYFNLKDINENLQERNAMLEKDNIKLRNEITELRMLLPDSTVQPRLQEFDYVIAHVISNSISQPNNYITINRGSEDGISSEMGVVDQNGVVGIVNVTGSHSARIISLLNPFMKLSCKLKNGGYFGSMVWDGKSPLYANLEELPKHLEYTIGDTVVTSGYSSIFPEGIIVGTVESKASNSNNSYVSLKVKLSTNFSQLSTVRVITNKMRDEIKSLEEKDNNKKGDKK